MSHRYIDNVHAAQVEGVGFDLASGITRVKDKIGGDRGQAEELHAQAPQITRVPTFARGIEHSLVDNIGMLTRNSEYAPDSSISMPSHPNLNGQSWW